MKHNFIQSVVEEICQEENIDFRVVSKDWIMILRKGDKTRIIPGSKFDLNGHGVGVACDDKYATYSVLTELGIPAAEHHIIFPRTSALSIMEYAKQYNYNLVVKANVGSFGVGMEHTTNVGELFEAIERLFEKNVSLSLCPYYKIKTEYRSIILNGNVELFYGKKMARFIGDGQKTIYELLYEFNPVYFQDKHKEEYDVVLPKGEEYEYNWQFNLKQGSIPFYPEDEVKNKQIQELALKAAKTMNVSFASVDIIELETGELLVLEINSGVSTRFFGNNMPNGREIVKEIYRKAIKLMFL